MPPVLHVTADYGVFSQTFVQDAMREVDRLGWEAWLLARWVQNREAASTSPPTNACSACQQRPPVGRPADVARGRQFWFWSPRRTEPAVRRSRPALVHAHFGWSAPDAVRVARQASAPLIVSFHGADVTLYPRLASWELPRRLRGREPHRLSGVLPAVDAAIVPSPVVEERVRELGYEGRLEVLPPGVRVASFDFRLEPPADAMRLLFVGRLTRRKGVDVLLHALAEALGRSPGLSLDIAGDGPERESLRKLAAELGVERRVRFRGVLSPDEVREALAAARVLVLPSRTMPDGEVETLGVVLLEAMAAGVAVVASNSGGIRHALPGSLRDELVAEDDPSALAHRMLAVLDDPDPADRARRGREWVEERYSQETLARRLASLYGELAGAPDARARRPA